MTHLARFNTLRDAQRLNDEFTRLFNLARGAEEEALSGGWVPPVDVYEDAEGVTLRFDVPGFDAAGIDLRLENGTLTLKGERRLDREDRKQGYSRVERFAGSFTRSFSLPTSVDADKVQADAKNGVLTVFLPRREETKPKQIRIKVEA
jgi:HSP20 family protein